MNDHEKIRTEMGQVQVELQLALRDLKTEVGGKLKPAELRELETEFAQLDELIERLKSGKIWISLFGKTSVGKSAIANALTEQDRATVGVQHDMTSEPTAYEHDRWMIVDVPGFMGKKLNEDIAIAEAKKAHGHVFVIDGEPFADELELFDLVTNALPKTPRIVFVNKWDVPQKIMPKRDQEMVRDMILQKMSKYVKSPADIVFGSAELFDPVQDRMIRQELPVLLDRMYTDAGTLGMVMGLIDPAHRADVLGGQMRDKIMEVRIRVARQVVSWFGTAAVAGGFIPFTQILVTPGILATMVFTVMRVLGHKGDRADAAKVAKELLKACAQELAAEFAADAAITAGVAALTFFTGGLALLGVGAILAAYGGMSYYKYRRTVILGEVTIEFVKNGCSWGGEERHAVIKRCKERALDYYMRLRGKD